MHNVSKVLPSADTGDCSDGVMVTSNEILTNPSTISTDTNMAASVSEPKNLPCVNIILTPAKAIAKK